MMGFDTPFLAYSICWILLFLANAICFSKSYFSLALFCSSICLRYYNSCLYYSSTLFTSL